MSDKARSVIGLFILRLEVSVMKKEWDGVGLPPVGTECEINHTKMGWVRCEIIARKHMSDGGKTHAIAWIDGDTLDQSQGIRFRPIRTAEQIAAEERYAEIESLRVLLSKVACDDYHAAVAVFDAGYRKQVQP